MHAAAPWVAVQANDLYMMRNGLLCNWPNVYWKAKFNERCLIAEWTDLIPSDEDSCRGAQNTTWIQSALGAHWTHLEEGNIEEFMQMYAQDSNSSYTIGTSGGTTQITTDCDKGCTRDYFGNLSRQVHTLSVVTSEVNVHGDRVSYAIDIMGFPLDTPPGQAAALLLRGVVMSVASNTSAKSAEGDHDGTTSAAQLSIETEDIVFEQFAGARALELLN